MKTGLRNTRRIDDRLRRGIRLTPQYALCFVFGVTSFGCAFASLERFDPNSGEKICDVWSAVLGTGETEQVTNACGDYAYGTRDTGISDNGKEALGEIAEGAVRGVVP